MTPLRIFLLCFLGMMLVLFTAQQASTRLFNFSGRGGGGTQVVTDISPPTANFTGGSGSANQSTGITFTATISPGPPPTWSLAGTGPDDAKFKFNNSASGALSIGTGDLAVPTAISLSPTSATVNDSLPANTTLSTASVTATGGTYSGSLVPSDISFYATSGLNVQNAHALTSADDGPHTATMTAVYAIDVTATPVAGAGFTKRVLLTAM